MGLYFDNLHEAMQLLAQNDKVVFMGQAVRYKGTAMTGTLEKVSPHQKIELPVAEEMQMGMSIGMALAGYIPVSFFTRENFLLCAMNQLVNHLDKLKEMWRPKYPGKLCVPYAYPKVIMRTSIGSIRPLDPQCQHKGDYTEAIDKMLTHIHVVKLEEADDILPAFQRALNRTDGTSTLLVEYGDFYNEK